MLTAFLKLLDIAARSLFVLLVLFSLPARESGQFGLVLILVTFFALFAGYERYLDLQRGIAQADPVTADRLVISTLRFYALGYLAIIPLFLACLVLWVQLPWSLVAMGVVIAVGEHLSNEAYRLAAIERRYRALVVVALGKNLLLLSAAVVIWWMRDRSLTLAVVLQLWGFLSAGVLAALYWIFALRTAASPGPLTSLARQFRASRTHFTIGTIAVLALQIDRLVAGLFLPLETSGVYFRHVFLASVAYQTLGILSLNRIMQTVYRHLGRREHATAIAIVRRERKIVVLIYASLAVGTTVLGCLDLIRGPGLDRIVPFFLAALIVSYLVRNLADYNCLVLNGIFRERDVLRSQVLGLAVSFGSSLGLTPIFGIQGLLASTLLGAAVYFVASTFLRKRAETEQALA